ncbi:hypothetical protein CDEST_11622 [Colletotrichum destructivum]|uniref:Uncharacterized protein n=1 Tax=Colletotrichum destructivum TaxID=34406 RepID=A0AAX4ITR0_9PEZI|nr:hypothetical protein CDEST_11622 [Colletotrichum destructivum]
MAALYDWSRTSRTQRTISLEGENTARLMRGLPPGQMPSLEDVIQVVQTDLNSASDLHRMESLQELLHDETLERLLKGAGSLAQKPIAMLIDGNHSGGRPRLGNSIGSLTATQLACELLKNRYLRAEPASSETFNAERRLIYLTDLDRWAILALVVSAPESLFRVMGDFILHYLYGTASIGVSFAPDGPTTFCLEFSFPFHVWRTSKRLSVDSRTRMSDGKPLRPSRDMTSLDTFAYVSFSPSETHGIYQSHVSCIVTGYDQRHWTGILTIDHWFEQKSGDGELSTPDSLERYQDDIECGMRTDPLSRGQEDAEISRWTPRPYFLRVMVVRLSQIIREWQELRYRMERTLEGFAKRYKVLRSQEELLEEARRLISIDENPVVTFLDKMLVFKENVSDINDALQRAVRSGDSFLKTDIFWFYPGREPMSDDDDCHSQLVQIQKRLETVRQLSEQFQELEATSVKLANEAENLRKKLHFRRHVQRVPRQSNSYQLGCFALISVLINITVGNIESIRWLPQASILVVAASLMGYVVRCLLCLNVRTMPSALLPGVSNFTRRPKGPQFLASVFDRMHSLLKIPTDSCSESGAFWSGSRLPPSLNNMDQGGSYAQDRSHRAECRNYVLRYVASAGPPNPSSKTPDGEFHGDCETSRGTGLIPVCVVRPDSDSEWLERNLTGTCHDDKSFFLSLKQLRTRNFWIKWANLFPLCTKRKVVGIHYVKFELRNDGSVLILERDAIPSASMNSSYRPTAGFFSPIHSDYLQACLRNPSILRDGSRNVLDRLIHKHDGPLKWESVPCTGYGLLLEEGIDHRNLEIWRLLSVLFSFFLSLLWGFRTGKTLVGMAFGNCLAILILAVTRSVNVTHSEPLGSNSFAI